MMRTAENLQWPQSRSLNSKQFHQAKLNNAKLNLCLLEGEVYALQEKLQSLDLSFLKFERGLSTYLNCSLRVLEFNLLGV